MEYIAFVDIQSRNNQFECTLPWITVPKYKYHKINCKTSGEIWHHLHDSIPYSTLGGPVNELSIKCHGYYDINCQHAYKEVRVIRINNRAFTEIQATCTFSLPTLRQWAFRWILYRHTWPLCCLTLLLIENFGLFVN